MRRIGSPIRSLKSLVESGFPASRKYPPVERSAPFARKNFVKHRRQIAPPVILSLRPLSIWYIYAREPLGSLCQPCPGMPRS